MKGTQPVDIYPILASKPHNSHYLNRYVNFIISCQSDDKTGYVEKHHICPKASDMFPEYECFRTNPWNCIKLTAREHFIAHMLLWKAFPDVFSVCFSVYAMSNKNTITSSRIYENMRIDFNKKQSSRIRGTAKYKDRDGNILTLRTDDPRVLSGEYVGHRKGAKINLTDKQRDNFASNVTVKDPNTNKVVRVPRTDPLYVSGYYVGVHKGTKRGPRSDETKEKLRIASSKPHPRACCIQCKQEMSAHWMKRHSTLFCVE